MNDTRVAETRKISKSAAVRTAGKVEVLYSYFTIVAAFNGRTGTLYITDTEWSHTTRRHLNLFKKTCDIREVVKLGQFELEEKVYVYLARRARRLQQRAGETLDDAALDRLDEQIVSAEDRASVTSAKAVRMPVGIPVVFVNPK